jgi:hypothetical protein
MTEQSKWAEREESKLEFLRGRERVHNGDKGAAVALRHLLHHRPPYLAVDAQGVDENLPHHRTPPFPPWPIVHEPVVAFRNGELRPPAPHRRQ